MLAIVQFLLAFLAVFFFLFLELDQLFFRHLIVLARREHGASAAIPRNASFALALFESGKISRGADGFGERAGFDQEFASFFQEIVQVIRLERVGKALLLKDRLRVFRGEQRNQKEHAYAFRRSRIFGLQRRIRLSLGEFLKYGEKLAANVG